MLRSQNHIKNYEGFILIPLLIALTIINTLLFSQFYSVNTLRRRQVIITKKIGAKFNLHNKIMEINKKINAQPDKKLTTTFPILTSYQTSLVLSDQVSQLNNQIVRIKKLGWPNNYPNWPVLFKLSQQP